MKKHLWWIPVAILALALVGQVAAYYVEGPTETMHASWQHRPRNIREARDRAHTAVRAQVVSVERGDDLVARVPGEPNGEDRIPTQRVTVNVRQNYKGQGRPGQNLVLFQTGGEQAPNIPPQTPIPTPTPITTATPAPTVEPNKTATPIITPTPRPTEQPPGGRPPRVTARQVVLHDDPPYRPGEEYVLLLETGPRGALRPTSPEGRYRIQQGRVDPVVDNEVTRPVRGRPVAELEAILREPPGPPPTPTPTP